MESPKELRESFHLLQQKMTCFRGLILSKYYELCHDPVCYLNMYINKIVQVNKVRVNQ